jgi:hypothetical protein
MHILLDLQAKWRFRSSPRGKSVDIKRRVHDRKTESEVATHLQKCASQHIHIHLKCICEVNEEMRRLLATAHGIEATGNHISGWTTTSEPMLNSQNEHSMCGVNKMLLEPK